MNKTIKEATQLELELGLGFEPEEFIIQGTIDDQREGKPQNTPGEKTRENPNKPNSP